MTEPVAGQTIAQGCWTLDPAASTLTVHVSPSGALSPALHEHHFVPTAWRGRVCFADPSIKQLSVEITVKADSLKDRQSELSKEDIRTGERQVREDVLRVAEHPEIRFLADRFDVHDSQPRRASGLLHGRLLVRGAERNLQVPVQAVWWSDRLRVTGDARFKQSSFGIEPYSRFLGTVGVQDELRVEFAVEATSPGNSGASR